MPVAHPVAFVQAPAHWRSLEFISDIHLNQAEPATAAAWKDYMRQTSADALFILGDLFEAWPGDDAARETGSFEATCAQTLRATSARLQVYFQHGNRDFLVGPNLLDLTGMLALEDPAVLEFSGQRYVLSHGDALCLDDVAYMKARAMVRQPAWQQQLLAKPLSQRRAIAQQLRKESEEHQTSADGVYADVDRQECLRWLDIAHASTMIHGHTHKPGCHCLDGVQGTRQRWVLSDWDALATPPRLEVLRLDASAGATRISLADTPA